MQKTIQLSFVLSALLSSLYAQNIELGSLEVTSTAIITSELKSTDAVEVYTQKDIEDAHVQNLYEFLNTQTSITTMPSYGNPFTQLIDIRGYGSANGNQNILIKLNGRKLNNIDNIPQLLSSISPASIKKIEIIKSSGIVMGGDGANAGVISITTKQDNSKEISLYAGNRGIANGSFYVGHTLDDSLSIAVAGEAQKNDGVRTINASNEKDKNKLQKASFDLLYTPSQDLELSLGTSFSKSSVIYGGALTLTEYKENPKQIAGATRNPNSQDYKTQAINIGLSYYLSDTLSLNIRATHESKTSDYEVLYPNTNIYTLASDYTYRSAQATLDYEADNFSLVTGVDFFYGTRDSQSNSDFGFGASQTSNTTKKNTAAAFIMTEYHTGANSFKAGYRAEKIKYSFKNATSDLDDAYSLKGVELGYNYTIDKESSSFVNFSHSYQAPNVDTFFSTSYPAPAFQPVVGFNTFIEPMNVNSLTVGYNNITITNKFKLSLYYLKLKDEIYLEPITFKNTNIDKSHKYGLDLYNKYLINENFNILLNYNYVQAIIDTEEEGANNYANKKLPGVSNHSAKITLNHAVNNFTTLSLTQVYRSQAYASNDFANTFTQKQDPYKSTDVSISYVKDNYEFFAKINNLFNQSNGIWIKDDAIYPINFSTTAIAGMKYKF